MNTAIYIGIMALLATYSAWRMWRNYHLQNRTNAQLLLASAQLEGMRATLDAAAELTAELKRPYK